MALLDRIAPYDSIREMEMAGVDRYWDGLTCALDGRYFGACYLLGYAIEMTLKVACFRASGVNEVLDLRGALRDAREMARARGVGNLHDLTFWAGMLVEIRESRGRALEPILAGAVIGQANEASMHWSEVLRYRRSISSAEECYTLLHIADWLFDIRRQLWS